MRGNSQSMPGKSQPPQSLAEYKLDHMPNTVTTFEKPITAQYKPKRAFGMLQSASEILKLASLKHEPDFYWVLRSFNQS